MGLLWDLVELTATWDKLQQLHPALVAGVPTLLCLVVAVYTLIEHGKSAAVMERWEDVCLQVFIH